MKMIDCMILNRHIISLILKLHLIIYHSLLFTRRIVQSNCACRCKSKKNKPDLSLLASSEWLVDVNSKFANFFDASQFSEPTMADSDVWRTASWGNVPWACASSIPKFWVVRTMVMAMGVVCVGDDGCRHGGRKIE